MTYSEPRVFSSLSRESLIHIVGITGVEGATVASFLLANGFQNLIGHALCDASAFEKELLKSHHLKSSVDKQNLLARVREWRMELRFGGEYLKGIEEAFVIFAPQSWELYEQENAPLFLLCSKLANIIHLYLELAPCKTIGVTGSDGKTTTTHLIAHLLHTAGRQAWLSGNYREGEQRLLSLKTLDPEGFLVLEISNRHLNFGLTKHPDIAVVTNVTENHLTEYEDFLRYRNVKERILGKDTRAVLNADNPFTAHMGDHCKDRLFFSRRPGAHVNGAFVSGGEIHDASGFICDVSDICLPGEHNVENVLAAITVVRSLGCSGDDITAGLKTFCAVPERLEFLTEIGGRKIFNDLSATSAESARRGLLAFKDTPVSMVVGGWTKGVDYDPFAQTILETGAHIFGVESEVTQALIAHGASVAVFPSAKEAIFSAYENTPEGGVVLVSPGGAFFSSKFLPEGLLSIISSLRSRVLEADQRT